MPRAAINQVVDLCAPRLVVSRPLLSSLDGPDQRRVEASLLVARYVGIRELPCLDLGNDNAKGVGVDSPVCGLDREVRVNEYMSYC